METKTTETIDKAKEKVKNIGEKKEETATSTEKPADASPVAPATAPEQTSAETTPPPAPAAPSA